MLPTLSELYAAEQSQKAMRAEYFHTVWGPDQSRVRIVLMHRGKRKHQDFTWPYDLDKIHDYVDEGLYEHDVYLNPVPLRENTTTATELDVKEVNVLWADLDHDKIDGAEEIVEEMDGFLVHSGTENHYHVYFPLTTPVDPDTAKILNTALIAKFGGDAKQSAASLLRVPFTLNHKQRNKDGGWVHISSGTQFSRVDVSKLEKVLELDRRSLNKIPDLDINPTPPTEVPARVVRAIESSNPDRSSKIHAVTLAAVESGMTYDEVAYIVLELPEAREKFRTDARILADIQRTLKKKQITDLFSKTADNKYGLFHFDGDIELTPVDYLIEDFLPDNAISVVAGQSGHGKSFVTIDMALSLATGSKWAGREVKKSRVIYLAMEGHNGFKSRVAAWVKHHGQQLDRSFASIPVNFSFKDDKSYHKLMNTVTDFSPDIIFIDTMVHAMTGWDENTVEDMQAFLSRVVRLHQEAGLTVVLVHHSSKDGASGLRGSSALRAAVDASFLVSKNGSAIKIATDKQKEGDDSGAEVFTLTQVPFNLINSFGNPAQDPAVVVHQRSVTGQFTTPEVKTQMVQGEIYEALKGIDGTPVSKSGLIVHKMNKSGSLYAPFSDAFAQLEIAGVLVATEETKNRTRGKQFVLAEDHEVQWTRMVEADKVVLEGRDGQDDQEEE